MTLYPGHGKPGGTAMLGEQRRYLLMYRETVRRLAGGRQQLDDGQREELEQVMRRVPARRGAHLDDRPRRGCRLR
jgi:hypothetical protein